MDVCCNQQVGQRVLAGSASLLLLLSGTSVEGRLGASVAAPSQAQEITIDLPGNVPMTFVRIPAGTFWMGAKENERFADTDEYPRHKVTLPSDYYLGKYEVTDQQWRAVMGGRPRVPGNHPAERSWEEVAGMGGFIEKLNRYLGTSRFRLPTEAEWERAARAGTETRFSFGDALECNDRDCVLCPAADPYAVWCLDSRSRREPVGSKLPNGFGLNDMHGNAPEWVQDWYAPYSAVEATNPRGPASGTGRVYRSYYGFGLGDCRSAARASSRYPSGASTPWNGFRLAMSLEEGITLSKGQVNVSVTFRNPYTSEAGTALPIPQGDRFAYFYFSKQNNPEVFVKVLDHGPESPFLLFYGGLTDFEYTVEFKNVVTGKLIAFKKPAGAFTGGGDNSALPHAQAKSVRWSRDGEDWSPIPRSHEDAPDPEPAQLAFHQDSEPRATVGPPGPGELSLLHGRVAASVVWRNPYSGQGGQASPLWQREEFGYFSFFSGDNPEVFVKVLDFGPDRPYLLFYAGLTDFEYTVTFRHTETGQTVSFGKDPFTYGGGADTVSLERAPCSTLDITPDITAVVGVASDSVEVYWTALPGASSYRLYGIGETPVYQGPGTSFTVTGLSENIYTCFRVQAVNDCGAGAESEVGCGAPRCPTLLGPVSVSATPLSASEIKVSWAPVTGTKSYRVVRSGQVVYEGTATSVTDAALPGSTRFCYTLTATSSCGKTLSSSPVCATTGSPLVLGKGAASN